MTLNHGNRCSLHSQQEFKYSFELEMLNDFGRNKLFRERRFISGLQTLSTTLLPIKSTVWTNRKVAFAEGEKTSYDGCDVTTG